MSWMPAAAFFGPMAAAIGLSYVLNHSARRIAPRIGWVDRPDGGRKAHQQATPVMGGVAFVAAILAVVGFAAWSGAEWLIDPAVRNMAFSLGASAICFCLLGVCDDRWPMTPRVKLLGQILASLPFVLLDGPVETICLLRWQIPLGWAGGPIAVLWLVGCANIVNLIDGLDGLAGSIGLVMMITIAALFGLQGHPSEALLTTVIAGGLIGFLCHNLPPAKIFMGDAGSMTIGFLAGALSIQASSKTATTFTLGVPLVLMSVPLFDTVMAILRRKLTGRSIGEGDRGHIHHRLQDRGLSRRQALAAIAGLTLIMAGAALLSVILQSETYGLAICAGVLALLILGRVFGYHETSLIFRHLKELGDLLVDTSGLVQTRFLLARLDHMDARQRSQLWDHVVERVALIQARRVEYECRSVLEERSIMRLSWENVDAQSPAGDAEWRIVYQVPREDGLIAVLEASGSVAAAAEPPRVDDLLRLFVKAGPELPTFDAALTPRFAAPPEFDAEEPTIAFPSPMVPQPLHRAA